MTIPDLQTWYDEYEDVPLVTDDSWKQNLADYLSTLTDGLLEFASYGPAGDHFDFVFEQDEFIAELEDVDETTGDGVEAIADGFAAAIGASTALVKAGSYIGTETPATTYSAVTSTIFTPTSIAAGRAKILELEDAELVTEKSESEFPEKLREAFLLLKANISGTNSVTPTAGPLNDPNRSVV